MFGLAFVKLQDFHTFAHRHKILRIGTFRLYLNGLKIVGRVDKVISELLEIFRSCFDIRRALVKN